MDKQKRKSLREQYMQMKTYIGIVQIKNKRNEKICISTCTNLKNRWLSLRMQLDIGRYPNAQLQKDWIELGEESFAYEVLEEKEVKEGMDVRWELKQMEKKWLEKLQPYGDRGYHRPPKEG